MRSRVRHIACCLVLALLASVGCDDTAPVDVEPTGEELDILTHALLIESVLQDFSLAQKDSLAARYYTQLYDRFGISEAGLDALRKRFSEDPVLWTVAADSLDARFEAHRDSLGLLLNVGVN